MQSDDYSTYNIKKTYDENYKTGPIFNFKLPKRIILKPINLWGKKINSPIGVPSGPLLNSSYIKLYSDLGFDVLVYKTVRTVEKKCHDFPNCLLVNNTHNISLNDINTNIQISNDYSTYNYKKI